MEAAEPGPAELHRAETGEDEARRRDNPPVLGPRRVVRVGPQRVVVTDALGRSA